MRKGDDERENVDRKRNDPDQWQRAHVDADFCRDGQHQAGWDKGQKDPKANLFPAQWSARLRGALFLRDFAGVAQRQTAAEGKKDAEDDKDRCPGLTYRLRAKERFGQKRKRQESKKRAEVARAIEKIGILRRWPRGSGVPRLQKWRVG